MKLALISSSHQVTQPFFEGTFDDPLGQPLAAPLQVEPPYKFSTGLDQDLHSLTEEMVCVVFFLPGAEIMGIGFMVPRNVIKIVSNTY